MDTCTIVQIINGIFSNYFCNPVAYMPNSLNKRLKDWLEEKKISVPAFEKQTGLPRDRVYKWLKRETAKISHEDAVVVEAWLNGKLDTIPNKTKPTPPPSDNSEEEFDLMVAVRQLSEATNRHSIIDERNSRNIERLIALLELKFGKEIEPVDLPELGGERVVDIREKSKKDQVKNPAPNKH